LLELDLDSISADRDVLHIHCIQVAKNYYGQGVAGKILDVVIDWARAAGWKELRANAIMDIRPLLAWSGQLSRGALERRGFSLVSSKFYPELREGVLSQRTGAHGVDVQKQWEEYSHVSDDEASFMFDMKLAL
jgi:GNAT superfamily N-acetyltransferase